MGLNTSADFAATAGEPDSDVYRGTILYARLSPISTVELFKHRQCYYRGAAAISLRSA